MTGPADTEQALFLTEACDFRLDHCGRPMRVKRSSTSWTGSWPTGTQNLTNSFECDRCGARLDLALVEPDGRPVDEPPTPA
ncbi:hypothetical protein [Actinoplanes sp. URMC 104]|uniref:hypothetical protein n=1 Tax=Actinoplanes sp. URMC 104 TaxID=3423409 RepID=UPI003F19E18E